MKLHVPSIPESGEVFTFDQTTDWFRALILNRFQKFCSPKSKAQGQLEVFRTNQNVSIHGKLNLQINPQCDRCAQKFECDLSVKLIRHMIPYFGSSEEKAKAQDETELSEEDLEFSCYHSEEIDLSDLVAEEVTLALPMHFYCREDCQGLCPRCGINLNEAPCACAQSREDSPFRVLKGYKASS